MAESGNDQERGTALICIRTLMDNNKGGNTTEGGETNKGSLSAVIANSNVSVLTSNSNASLVIPNSNVSVGEDLDELLRRNEKEIETVRGEIATVNRRLESAKRADRDQRIQSMGRKTRQNRRGDNKTNTTNAASEHKSAHEALNSAYAALAILQNDRKELLEKCGPQDPRYQECAINKIA